MRQLSFGKMTAMAISDDKREFFIQPGTRVAELRKFKWPRLLAFLNKLLNLIR